jgi:hypothetical protein
MARGGHGHDYKATGNLATHSDALANCGRYTVSLDIPSKMSRIFVY